MGKGRWCGGGSEHRDDQHEGGRGGGGGERLGGGDAVDVRSASPVPVPVQRPRPQRSAILPSSPPLLELRLEVATLAPTPHRPKVVAQIKAPCPMSDMLIDMEVLRPHTARLLPPAGDRGILVLTGEEIKDVINCTGLWVIVREGYGGLAKRRKGGWMVDLWVIVSIVYIRCVCLLAK